MSELNIPEHWAEAPINDINNLQYGKNLSTSEFTTDGYPVFGANGQIGFYHEYHYEEPQILITCRGATCGMINISQPKSFVTNNSIAIIPKGDSLYRKDFLRYALMMINPATIISGSAQPQITLGNLDKINLPIPPFQEQKRIVQKIEFCFHKIDETEKVLIEVEVLLTKYRESLLAKAFRGELIPQDAQDEPTGEALAINRRNRVQNQQGNFSSILDSEEYFDIPKSWTWCELQDVSTIRGGKRVPLGDQLLKYETNRPYIKAGALKGGTILDDKIEFLSEQTYQKIKNYTVKKGDVVITNVGACIGDTSIVPDRYDGANLTENALRITDLNGITNEFLFLWLTSGIAKEYLKKITASAAQGKLALGRLALFPIPLPPVNEQIRIVQKIYSSLGLVEEESQNISNKLKILKKIKESILREAFEGRLVEKISSEGTGHELLKKISTENEISNNKSKPLSNETKKL